MEGVLVQGVGCGLEGGESRWRGRGLGGGLGSLERMASGGEGVYIVCSVPPISCVPCPALT